jgi:hypothetical protein
VCLWGIIDRENKIKDGFEREKVGNLREKQRIWKGEEVEEKLASKQYN